MGSEKNSGAVLRPGFGGAQEGTGPKPLYVRITQEQLERACTLIRSGRATVEAALGSEIVTSNGGIYRARDAGIAALEKHEAGLALTELEERALAFYREIWTALSAREIVLTRQATGDANVQIGIDRDGQPIYASNDPRIASNCLKIMQLTCKHWAPKTETTLSGSLTTGTPEQMGSLKESQERVRALEARLQGLTDDG